jgi:phosphohistidine phosphatase
MKQLFLLRHAKSSWDDSELVDHDRPLAPRGRRAVKLIAEHLRREGVTPDLVLCSSALRTRETLEGIAPALGESRRALSGCFPVGAPLARRASRRRRPTSWQ